MSDAYPLNALMTSSIDFPHSSNPYELSQDTQVTSPCYHSRPGLVGSAIVSFRNYPSPSVTTVEIHPLPAFDWSEREVSATVDSISDSLFKIKMASCVASQVLSLG